jgi:protein-S-isoprenylcysteine O-methyltransferase Ste14
MITIAALMLYLAWLAVAFGLRSIIQRRRTGDAGWRSPGGRPDSIQWWTRVVVGIGAVTAGLAAPIADLLGLSPISGLDRPWLQTIGLVLPALATVATVAAQQAMGTAWRIGVDETERTTLVTNGVFRVVRNPFFSAVIGFATGLALAVPNIIALAGLATMVMGECTNLVAQAAVVG